MAHFAQLDENNVVTRVIVVHNNELLDNGVEREELGIAFCQGLFGGTWVQTSYHGTIRKNYAGIGYTYDTALDAFVPPKPFPSWVLTPETARWEAPIPMPNDGNFYAWNEETQQWEQVEVSFS